MQAERFHRAVGQVLAIGVEGRETPDIHIPEVERGFAADDPLGDKTPGAAGIGNARGVEARANEIAGNLRRFAEDEIAVTGEALGAVQQHPDLGGFEARRSVDRVGHQDFELIPVLGQQLELEPFGDPRRIPRLGDRLESAHHEAADFLLVVDEAVGIADHRQRGRHAGNRLGDDVEVFGGIERNIHAGHAPEFARPLAAAVDEGLAGDFAFVRVSLPSDSGHAATVHPHADDFHALEYRGAARPGALGERLREIGGVGLSVAGNPHGAGKIVGAQDRRDRRSLGRRHIIECDAEAFCARHLALDQLHALRRLRDIQATALLPAGGKAGFLLQRRVELDAVLAHPRRVAGGASLPNKARCVPCRAAR